MMSDITFRMKITSKKNKPVTLGQLTKYSCNTTKQYKKHALITDKFLMKLSTHPESAVACKIYKILPCHNEIFHAVLS